VRPLGVSTSERLRRHEVLDQRGVEHEPEQYLEQEARNGFEFGLERLLDGIEAYLSRG
jgi:hypothetical protein